MIRIAESSRAPEAPGRIGLESYEEAANNI